MVSSLTAGVVLGELRRAGAVVWCDTQSRALRVKAPRGVVSPSLAEQVTALAAEIARLIEDGPPSDTSAPSELEALEEYAGLNEEQRAVFFACRAVLIEQGAELHQAERDAVAAVLQHQRLTRTPLRRRELHQAESWVAFYLRKGLLLEDAEKASLARVLAHRRELPR